MGSIINQISRAFRDFVVDGIRSSGAQEVDKLEVRAIGPLIESAIANAAIGSLVDVIKDTAANLDADLAHDAGSVALVYADTLAANNDLYVKSGASGTGSWGNTGALQNTINTLAAPLLDDLASAVDGLAVVTTQRVGIAGTPGAGGGSATADVTWRLGKQFTDAGQIGFGAYFSANTAITAIAEAADGTVHDSVALSGVGGQFNEYLFSVIGLDMPEDGRFALYVEEEALAFTSETVTADTQWSSVVGLYSGGGGWVEGSSALTLQMYAINRTAAFPLNPESFTALQSDVSSVTGGAQFSTLQIGATDPTSSSAVNVDAASTFIHNTRLPAGAKYYLHSLSRPAGAGGNIIIAPYSRFDGRAWKAGSFEAAFATNEETISVGNGLPFIPLFERQVPALCNDISSPLPLLAVAGTSGGGWFASSGSPAEVDMSSPSFGYELQWRFDIREVPGGARKLYGEYLLQSTSMMHVIAYPDQSNTSGADSVPPLSTTANLHWSFGVGPKMTKPDIVGPGGAAGINPDDGEIAHLVEDTAAVIAGASYGETPLSSLAKSASRRALRRDAPFPLFFGSYAGFPGTTLVNLAKGQPWYENYTYHIETARDAVEAGGFNYSVPILITGHGESDQANGTTVASYYATAREIIDDVIADAMDATGQTWRPHVVVITPTYHIKTSAGATDAWNRLARERDDVHVIAPGYRFPYANGTHFSNLGQILRGEYWGRAIDQIFAGFKPDAAEWLGFTANGAVVYATIRAPKPVGWDSLPAGMQVADKGVVIWDAASTPLTISSMAWSVIGVDKGTGWPISMLTIVTNGAPARFRYALDAQGSDMFGVGGQITAGASGNICDTTTDAVTISGVEYSMAHWAQPVNAAIAAIE